MILRQSTRRLALTPSSLSDLGPSDNQVVGVKEVIEGLCRLFGSRPLAPEQQN